MKSYGEYCPIAMGAEVLGDRWTPLVLRELICGSERFTDIDPDGSSVCQRDEGFEVDLWVEAEISEFMRVWMGRATWREAIKSGALTLIGPRLLVRAFPHWFALSPFAAAR